MNQTTQHISPNPARDFANAILEETNGALELIDILRDIAEGNDEDATTNDRIAANVVLTDRGLGRCPRQSPATNPDHAPERSANEPKGHSGPDSPRLVTQIDESLNQSLGPPPSAHPLTRRSREKPALVPRHGGGNPESYGVSYSPEPENPDPLDPYSIQTSIQEYILTITNNGQTLRDAMLEIARAKEDPGVKTSHRRRAATLLLERAVGSDPNAVRNAVCPECRRKWSTHPDSHTHPERNEVQSQDAEEDTAPDPKWVEAVAEVQRMKDEGILTPDPNAPKIDYSVYMTGTEEEISPYADEVVAAFSAKLDLQVERQKQWPEIEERRRKKLAKIYPSHSEDDKTPDT